MTNKASIEIVAKANLKALQRVIKTLDAIDSRMAVVTQALDKMSSGFRKTDSNVARTKKGLDKTGKALKEMGRGFKKVGKIQIKSQADAAKAVADAQKRQIRLFLNSQRIKERSLKAEAAATKKAVNEIAAVRKKAARVREAAIKKQSAAMSALSGNLRAASESMNKFAHTSFLMGAAFTAAGVAIVKVSADFESALTRAATIATGTRNTFQKNFESMSASAIEVANTTEHTASQVADGMNFMAMAGMGAVEINASIATVAKLATAANLSMADSADIVTNAMAGFGVTSIRIKKELEDLTGATVTQGQVTEELASRTSRAGNVLVGAITSSNVNLSNLNESLKVMGSVASQVNIPMEDVAAALGLLGNVGVKGTEAGTGLKRALTALVNPSKQTALAMKEIGLTNQSLVGPDGFLKTIAHLEGIKKTMKAAGRESEFLGYLFRIFGERAGPKMASLVAQGSTAMISLSSSIRKAKDESLIDIIEERQLSTFSGAIKVLGSNIASVAKKIGDELRPALVSIVGLVKSAVQTFDGLGGTMKKVVAWGTAFGAIGLIFAGITAKIGVMVLNITVAVIALQKLAAMGAVANLAIVTSFKGMAVAAIAAAKTMATVFATKVIPVVGALALSFFTVREAMDSVNGKTEHVSSSMKHAFEESSKSIRITFINLFAFIGSSLAVFLDGLVQGIAAALAAIGVDVEIGLVGTALNERLQKPLEREQRKIAGTSAGVELMDISDVIVEALREKAPGDTREAKTEAVKANLDAVNKALVGPLHKAGRKAAEELDGIISEIRKNEEKIAKQGLGGTKKQLAKRKALEDRLDEAMKERIKLLDAVSDKKKDEAKEALRGMIKGKAVQGILLETQRNAGHQLDLLAAAVKESIIAQLRYKLTQLDAEEDARKAALVQSILDKATRKSVGALNALGSKTDDFGEKLASLEKDLAAATKDRIQKELKMMDVLDKSRMAVADMSDKFPEVTAAIRNMADKMTGAVSADIELSQAIKKEEELKNKIDELKRSVATNTAATNVNSGMLAVSALASAGTPEQKEAAAAVAAPFVAKAAVAEIGEQFSEILSTIGIETKKVVAATIKADKDTKEEDDDLKETLANFMTRGMEDAAERIAKLPHHERLQAAREAEAELIDRLNVKQKRLVKRYGEGADKLKGFGLSVEEVAARADAIAQDWDNVEPFNLSEAVSKSIKGVTRPAADSLFDSMGLEGTGKEAAQGMTVSFEKNITGLFTSGGMLSTVGGAIGSLFGGVGAPVGAAIGSMVEKALPVVKKAFQLLVGAVKKMFSSMASFAKQLFELPGGAGEGGSALGGAIGKTGSLMKSLAVASGLFAALNSIVAAVVSSFVIINYGTFLMGAAIKAMLAPLLAFMTVTEALAQALRAVLTAFVLFPPVFLAALHMMTAGLGAFFVAMAGRNVDKEGFDSSRQRVLDAFAESVDRITIALDPLWQAVMPLVGLFDYLLDVMMPLVDSFAGAGSMSSVLFQGFKMLAVGIGMLLLGIGYFVSGVLSILVGGFGNPLHQFMGNLMETIAQGVVNVIAWLMRGLANIFKEIDELIPGPAILSPVTTGLNNAADDAEAAAEGLVPDFDDLNQSIIDGLNGMMPDLDGMHAAFQELLALSEEDADMRGNALADQRDQDKNAKEISESLSNVPSGFKVALHRFKAMDAVGGVSAGGGGNILDLSGREYFSRMSSAFASALSSSSSPGDDILSKLSEATDPQRWSSVLDGVAATFEGAAKDIADLTRQMLDPSAMPGGAGPMGSAFMGRSMATDSLMGGNNMIINIGEMRIDDATNPDQLANMIAEKSSRDHMAQGGTPFPTTKSGSNWWNGGGGRGS